MKKKGYFNCNIDKVSNIRGKQVAILSVPTITHYKNKKDFCSKAPKVLLAESKKYVSKIDSWDFDTNSPFVKNNKSFADLGIFSLSKKANDNRKKLSENLKKLVKNKVKFLVIGGDDSVSIPPLAALQALTHVHLLQVDAHLDWRNEMYGEKFGRSSVMRRASEMPWIAGMTQIGLRGLGNSKEKDLKDAKKWGSKIISDQKMTKMSSEQMIKHIPNKIPLYLTLDLDGINPVEFPGVVSRAPGGPGISKIVELILAIGKNKNLIGANLVEFAPSKDIDNISLNATIRLLMLIIHILNKKK